MIASPFSNRPTPARTVLACALLASTTFIAHAAHAKGPVYRDSSKSVEVDLALPNATVCVVKPIELRVAEDCVGIDLAFAEKMMPAKTELVATVREGTGADQRVWALSLMVIPQPGRSMMSIESAKEYAEGARVGAAGAAKRNVQSFGLAAGETHTLLVSGGGQIIRQRLELTGPEGSEAPPMSIAMGSIVGQGGIATFGVLRGSPPTLDVDEALTKALARTTVTPPPGPLEWRTQSYWNGYLASRVLGPLCVLLVLPAVAVVLVIWQVRKRRKTAPDAQPG